VIGFLNLDSSTPGFFTEAHAQRLQFFADQASIAIEHAQLYEEIRRYSSQLEKRVEERTAELNQAKDRIEAILNSTTDIIILCLPDGVVNQVNPAFEKVLNCGPDQFYGKSLPTLVVPEHVPGIEQALMGVIDTARPQRLEATIRCSRGKTFDADIVLSPIVEADRRITGVVCSLRDMTERKQMENKLRQMLEHEMELSELKSRYVSMAAHDLRNPLAAIQSSISLIHQYSDRLTGEKIEEKYSRIQETIDFMVDMLDDILTLDRVESGNRQFNPAPLDLVTFCQTVATESTQAAGTIVQQSVDLHGGTISFESEEGRGTTFTVVIPRILPEE
jgi:PAS domain S-box-containing protein